MAADDIAKGVLRAIQVGEEVAPKTIGKFAKWLAKNVGDSNLPRLRSSGFGWEATGPEGKRMRQVAKMLQDMTPEERTIAQSFKSHPRDYRYHPGVGLNIPENSSIYNAWKRSGGSTAKEQGPYVVPEFQQAAGVAAKEAKLPRDIVQSRSRPVRAVGIYRKLNPRAQEALIAMINGEHTRPGSTVYGLPGNLFLKAREVGNLSDTLGSLALTFMRDGMSIEDALAAARALG
jgi:hypothetical protein